MHLWYSKLKLEGKDMERVFMDAWSGINLIYAKMLRAMRISLDFLKPTDCSFHRIVPGSANYPLGRITLGLCFGNHQNYRKEKLDFEVMDWPSQYHAILERPTLSCFMEVPHLWGPRFTTRDSRYAYNSRSHDQYVVSPHNRADIKVTSSITIPNIKSYSWSHDQDW
jgi:hypothetical protein